MRISFPRELENINSNLKFSKKYTTICIESESGWHYEGIRGFRVTILLLSIVPIYNIIKNI